MEHDTRQRKHGIAIVSTGRDQPPATRAARAVSQRETKVCYRSTGDKSSRHQSKLISECLSVSRVKGYFLGQELLKTHKLLALLVKRISGNVENANCFITGVHFSGFVAVAREFVFARALGRISKLCFHTSIMAIENETGPRLIAAGLLPPSSPLPRTHTPDSLGPATRETRSVA